MSQESPTRIWQDLWEGGCHWVPHTVGKQAAYSAGNAVGSSHWTVMPLRGIVHTPQMASHRSKKDEEGWRRTVLSSAIPCSSPPTLYQQNITASHGKRDVFTKSTLGQKVKESESRSVVSNFLWTIHGNLQGRILEWLGILFSRGSSQPRDWTQVSHIADGFFAIWATREAQIRATQVDLELRGYKPITSSHLLWLQTSTCILLGIFELCQHKAS